MNIWLVGGTTVIPTSVETAIKGDGYNVTRINGSDRYETAAMIADAGIKISGKKPSKVFVASGTSFADALAVSPVAFVKGYPIILTDKDSTSDFSKKELGVIGTDSKVLVGGTAVVSDKVAADLSIKSDARVAGADRAVTANLISDWAKKSEGFNPANAALVGGTNGNGADSLVAAPLLGKSFTTLHFAGWDATTVYLKDHSSELTGKGFVFGGKAAVSDGQVGAAQSAAQSVAAAAAFVVTDVTGAAGGSFKYADPKAKKAVTANFASTDTFTVDGQKASSGAFAASLSIADQVVITKSGSAMTFALTSVDRAKIMSGTVGNTNTSAATTFDFIDPVTGVALNSSAIDYTTAYTFYTIDGNAATQAQFELDINDGDTIVISGGDGLTSAKPRTIALTNRTVAGSLDIDPSAAGKLSVKSSSGAVVGNDNATGTGAEFTLGASDSITYNGAVLASTAFTAASGVTAGDTVTYSRKGGVQTVVVDDAAPAAITGVVASGATAASLTYWLDGGSSAETGVNVATSFVLTVDGALVSPTEFTAALSAGDEVVIQRAGGSVSAYAAVTSKNLSGKVSAVSGSTLTVRTASDTGNLATVDYTNSAAVFSGNTTTKFTVNGTEVTQSQFASEVSFVANGTKTATLQASDSGTQSTYALVTATNTASAKLATSPGFTGAAGTTTVTIKFDKPVYLAAPAANGDFTFTGAGLTGVNYTTASPNVAANASNTIVLTVPSTTTSTGSLVVNLTAQGAAKFLDANGVATTASSVTIAVA